MLLGLIIHEDWLISTSIDQRVVLQKLIVEDGTVIAEIVNDVIVTVPDAHGLTLLQADSNTINACVYGKGIETVEINLKTKL